MDNILEQYAIGDLLDGRYFYIPAFQRGYRWTEKQVGDLLHDLLVFSYEAKDKDGEFYSLQPIIARPMTSEEIQKLTEDGLPEKELKEKGVWEIIDGQQRLTTLFLIYKYLLKEKGWDAEKLKNRQGRELYHLSYATRKGSMPFLEGDLSEVDPKEEKEMDFFYMLTAYRHIGHWIEEKGKVISDRFGMGGDSLDDIEDALFRLFNAKKGTKKRSVQVLWYELPENQGADSVGEFQKLNTGKLPLTEAELIKSLFLQSKNFGEGDREIRKAHLALEWEHIEDTLREDAFWSFLRKRETDLPNRIDLLFTILYKLSLLKEQPENDWSKILNKADKELNNPRNSILFRNYFDRFEGLEGKKLQEEIRNAWEEVTDLFRLLDDWYSSPELYNLVGLLSQFGEDIALQVTRYSQLEEREAKRTFAKRLKEQIQKKLPENLDDVSYKGGRDEVFRTLLALNVAILSQQIQERNSASESYKFPFDLFNAQKWDIEHIDSFHTNELKKKEDKIQWIDVSLKDLGGLIKVEDRKAIDDGVKNGHLDQAIDRIKKLAEEEENEEENNIETKNSLGNLTLLDKETNTSYGNSLFCTKRRIIIERLEDGVFVPIATQFVFAKYFDPYGTNRTKWTRQDMASYSDFIADKLKEYFDTESNTNGSAQEAEENGTGAE